MSPEEKAAKRMTKTAFEKIANKYVFSTMAELEAAMKSPETPAMEQLLCSILLAGIKQGDHAKAEWFATRLMGKVQDKVEVTTPKPFVMTKLNGEQVIAGARLEEPEE